MDLWASALIVGIAVCIVGYIAIASGKKKISAGNFTPTHTIESLKKDKHAVQRVVS